MHFRTPLIIRNIIGNDVTGRLPADLGFFSHRLRLLDEERDVFFNFTSDKLGKDSRL